MNFNLAFPFYESARRNPGAAAVHTESGALSYEAMLSRVMALADWLLESESRPRRVGILGSRSADACVAILSAAWVGATYVPINLGLPETARAEVIQRSALDAIVADVEGSALLTPAVLANGSRRVVAHAASVEGTHPVTDWASLRASGREGAPVQVEAAHPGYILYTSGTTGTPKGVVIPAGALAHMLEVMQEKYPIHADDRVAETSATSFDISVYNMFSTWKAGASLHIVPYLQTLAPSRFMVEHAVSVWFSVPSVANVMSRTKLLRPGSFPALRQTLFCGEPLLAEIAAEWQLAAPNSIVTNMYGPTEATVFCMGQDYSSHCVLTRDTVGIGRCLRGTEAAILAPEGHFQPEGEAGELLLSGAQLALGYLDDAEKTDAKFVTLEGVRWYRTGDLAMRDASGFFHFLGRVDNQVKIMGFRVELEDIEFQLRKVSGCEGVCAIAWPLRNGTAAGIVAFLQAAEVDAAHLKEELRKYLPNYFVPSQIRSVRELPKNANGKVDRNALLAELRQEAAK